MSLTMIPMAYDVIEYPAISIERLKRVADGRRWVVKCDGEYLSVNGCFHFLAIGKRWPPNFVEDFTFEYASSALAALHKHMQAMHEHYKMLENPN